MCVPSGSFICTVPGSLSSIAMNAVLGETISTAPGSSVELIITLKYSDSSVVLLSMVDTIKVADVSPAVKVTVYGPGVKSLPAVNWKEKNVRITPNHHTVSTIKDMGRDEMGHNYEWFLKRLMTYKSPNKTHQ